MMHDWTLVQSCIFYAFSPLFRNRPSLLVTRKLLFGVLLAVAVDVALYCLVSLF